MYCPTKELDEKYTNSNNNQARTDKSKSVSGTVCAFWLKGSCKNGNNCKFLHEKNPDKYPECPYGINCTRQNIDCLFKHTKKTPKECHAYNSGYCSHGKNCKDLHKEQNICLNYLLGFCPDGPNCKLYHFKTTIPDGQDNLEYLARSLPQFDQMKNQQQNNNIIQSNTK